MDLKIKDVADLLHVSESTIRRWIVEEKIPAYRIHRQFRFNRTEIEAWVMNHKVSNRYEPSLRLEEDQSHEAQNSGGLKQFSLYRAVHKGGVIHGVPGSSKEEIIRTTTETIAETLNLDAEMMSNLLMDRERMQSTGLGNGIAIPHTRDYLLNNHQDAVVIAFPEHPLDYSSIDEKPVHTLFFLFACEDKRHLHLLAKIAHLSTLPEMIDLLKTHPSKEVLLEYIKTWESSKF